MNLSKHEIWAILASVIGVIESSAILIFILSNFISSSTPEGIVYEQTTKQIKPPVVELSENKTSVGNNLVNCIFPESGEFILPKEDCGKMIDCEVGGEWYPTEITKCQEMQDEIYQKKIKSYTQPSTPIYIPNTYNNYHYNDDYKYNYRTGTTGSYEYNYDVEGYDSYNGGYVYGNIDTDEKEVEGYLYTDEGEEVYVSGEWVDYGEIEVWDDYGNYYELDVE